MKPRTENLAARRYRVEIAWLAAGVLLALAGVGNSRRPLLAIDHAPALVSRRSGALPACVTGVAHPFVQRVEYRLNRGEWRLAEPGRLALALPATDLWPGGNRLEIRAQAPLRGDELWQLAFDYDASPVCLPATLPAAGDLEVIQGAWQRVAGAGGSSVRPRGAGAGRHVLLVCGAFAGSRRVRARARVTAAPLAGDWAFGVLPLTGGPVGERDRAEASFAFRSEWEGVEAAFRLDVDGRPPLWTHTGISLVPRTGVRYELLADCLVEPRRDGEGQRHVLRCKWWPTGQTEPQDWIETGDDEGAPLPPGDYGVALMAHGCRVEFSDVRVEAR
jgi:hypothetical protein